MFISDFADQRFRDVAKKLGKIGQKLGAKNFHLTFREISLPGRPQFSLGKILRFLPCGEASNAMASGDKREV